MQVRTLTAVLVLCLVACGGHDSGPTAPPTNTAALTGKVTDAATSVPLERVEVSVTQSGQTISTLTSSTGSYSFFTGLLPGTISITAKATGYVTSSGTTNVATGSNRYDIQLRAQS